ncbi:MAG TPA: hypothetical protein VMF56_05910 [Acidobacteriaceae bacterium]|nr:hypothetical protein [Acidobacteriaceae bacterium]
MQASYSWWELLAPTNIPSWFLLGAAIWAGWIAIRTLGKISVQTDCIEKQTHLMLVKERAHITIAAIPPSEPDDPTVRIREMSPPPIQIVNQGLAYAYDVSCHAAYFADPERNLARQPTLYPYPIPAVLKSTQEFRIDFPIPLILPGLGDGGIDPIDNERLFAHIYVAVSYRDVFGDMPNALLHLLWKIDIETIETGNPDDPYVQVDHSEWEPIDSTPELLQPAPQN